MIEGLGRNAGNFYYVMKCDVEGCSKKVEFHMNEREEKVDGWNKATMFDENNTAKETKHFCPKH